MVETEKLPLCVDLDGTLVNSDTLTDSLFFLIKNKPSLFFKALTWPLKGKAYFKHQVAQFSDMSVENLPYNEKLIDYLKTKKESGNKLLLVTGANKTLATKVADHIGLFDDVIASDEINNVGKAKSDELVKRFGANGFLYAGNSYADLKVWNNSKGALLVNPAPFLKMGLRHKKGDIIQISQKKNFLACIIRAIRVQQWAKNLLLLLPFALSHQKFTPESALKSFFIFASFSFMASSVYLINDLVDLDADRNHPRKKNRPLAAGQISITFSSLLTVIFFSASLFLAQSVSLPFLYMLLAYFVVTSAYSFKLKKIALLDVLILAGLYTMRIIAGGIGLNIPVSSWLLGFSMFLFFSLALVKRFIELRANSLRGQTNLNRREYDVDDIAIVQQMGVSSGYVSLVILAIYITSQDILALYSHPNRLWLLFPFFMYWISRIWLKAQREIIEDPIVYTLKDKTSYVIGVCVALIVFFSI